MRAQPIILRFLPALAATALLCLFGNARAAEYPKDLAWRVDGVLAQSEAARSFWGVEIVDLDTGTTVYARNADRLFTPASTQKLFTTATALGTIGSSYQFHTTVEAAAAPDKFGRVAGDLVLVGRGDPNLSGRSLPYQMKTERPFPPEQALAELADQVVAHGVKQVDGDIVADDSYYGYERYAEGWAQDDLVWEWGAPVSALTINDNMAFLHVGPGEKVGDRALVTLAPFAGYFHLDNQVTTTAGGERKLSLQRQPGSRRIELTGVIPLGDAGSGLAVAIDEPAEFCAMLLKELLLRRGVVLYGGTRARHTAAAGAKPPVTLADHVSAPLSLDLTVINKVSQNLHAEMLLRLLGREKGSGATFAGGLEVVSAFLARAGITSDEFAFHDGSGLSRQDLVTPHALVKLLSYAARQPWSAEFAATLPRAGVDGTMRNRLHDLPAGTQLLAKTGSLDHVNSIAGYLTTAKGGHYAFAIMANNHTLESYAAGQLMDEILTALARPHE